MKKPPFDSALKTINAQMFFWSVFLKTHQKKLLTVKNGRFWQLITVFLCVFKNADQNNIYMSIVLKAKTEKNKKQKLVDPQKRAFLSSEIKTIKQLFLLFFFCFSF